MKIIFGIIALFIAMVFGMSVSPALAADATNAREKISAQEAAELNSKLEMLKNVLIGLERQAALEKQKEQAAPAEPLIVLTSGDVAALQASLTGLQNVLVALQSRLENKNLPSLNEKAVADILAGITNSLAAVNSTLKNSKITLIDKPLPAPLALAPPTLKVETETAGNAADETAEAETADESLFSAEKSELTASTEAALNKKNLPLISLIIGLIAAAASGFWLWKAKFGGIKTETAKQA